MVWLNPDRGFAIGGIIVAIVLVVLDKAAKLSGPILFWLLLIAAGMTIPIALSIPWVARAGGPQRFARCALMVSLVGVAYSLLGVWISGDMKGPTAMQADNQQPRLPNTGSSQSPPASNPKVQIPQGAGQKPIRPKPKRPIANNPSSPRPEQSTPSQTSAPGSTPRDRPTFEHMTVIGGGTALLDCDPLATFDDLFAATTSQTRPAVDVGSSQCDNQESFSEYGAWKEKV
jgi:hypothetical protein